MRRPQRSILIDVAYADPQAAVHQRARIADKDGSVASSCEARKRNHYTHLGRLPFDDHSHKLGTAAMEAVGVLEGNKANSSIGYRRV